MTNPDTLPEFHVLVGAAARESATAVLPLICDFEILGGSVFQVSRRPQAPFLPERLAISWPAADQFDILDLSIGHWSLFPDFFTGGWIPEETVLAGSSFAARWRYDGLEQPLQSAHGPLPAIVTSTGGPGAQLGRKVPKRTCPMGEEIQLRLRARPGTARSFEALILGRVWTP